MKAFSQLDPRWSSYKIGATSLTLGRWGCLITSLAMGHSRLFPKNTITPKELADILEFTKTGLLIHNQSYPDFSFSSRVWNWEEAKIKDWMRSRERFAVIAVNNNSHFVIGYYWGVLGLWCIDPIDGKRKLLSRYYEPCGAILYHKI